MKVILKNGDGLSLEEGARCSDAAKAINESLARNAVAAKVNGALCDLSHELKEGDKLELLTLKDHEGLIKKIDRHKRRAYLELEMFGRKIETQVGLEVVAKR